MSSESPTLRRKRGTKHKGRARLLPPLSTEAHRTPVPQPLFPREQDFDHKSSQEGNSDHSLSYFQHPSALPGFSEDGSLLFFEEHGRKRLSTQIRNSLDGFPTYHEMMRWLEMAQSLELLLQEQEKRLLEQEQKLRQQEDISPAPPRPRPSHRKSPLPAQMTLFQKKR
ncbi:MAG: hypothetical protein H6728_17425 [Myxococcales bacterium]|nr:hypothetical protein [Myxococcales bacterium]